MRRRLLNLLTALSLLACFAVCVLWVRSHLRHDTWQVERRQVSGTFWKSRRTELHSVAGRLIWSEVDERLVPMMFFRMPGSMSTTPPAGSDPIPWSDVSGGGIRWLSDGDSTPPPREEMEGRSGGGTSFSRQRRTRWEIPHGAVALALATPSTLLLAPRLRRAYRRNRRAAVGLCATCGYNLRATPGRCPECGTATDKPA